MSQNNSHLGDYLSLICPLELDVKDTTYTQMSPS